MRRPFLAIVAGLLLVGSSRAAEPPGVFFPCSHAFTVSGLTLSTCANTGCDMPSCFLTFTTRPRVKSGAGRAAALFAVTGTRRNCARLLAALEREGLRQSLEDSFSEGSRRTHSLAFALHRQLSSPE